LSVNPTRQASTIGLKFGSAILSVRNRRRGCAGAILLAERPTDPTARCAQFTSPPVEYDEVHK
jgi:hypothetical protein